MLQKSAPTETLKCSVTRIHCKSVLCHYLTLCALLQAMSALSAPLKALNDLLHTKAGRKSPTRLADVAVTVASVEAVMGGLLGLDTLNPSVLLQV